MPTNTWPICGQRAWEGRLQFGCLTSWDSWKLLSTTLPTTGEALRLLSLSVPDRAATLRKKTEV